MVFVAVYAGVGMAEAKQVLGTARSKFPKASIKRVQASYTRLVE